MSPSRAITTIYHLIEMSAQVRQDLDFEGAKAAAAAAAAATATPLT